jgi:dTDP-4-amino-4,6-dideoxygalactose transaminase
MIEYENLGKLNRTLFEKYHTSFESFLESGWYILGNRVKKFESEFSNYCGVSSAAGVASGLDALIIALDALDLPPCSEIIVPSNTYIATIMAIIRAGHTPVLVEPDIETYNIDPVLIKKYVTKKTKAILIVHLYGKCCNMDEICNIADLHKIQIIEDAAQAHGAKFKNKMAGSFGIGCFSFYPTKNLGALGDGGAILSNNIDFIDRVKCLRNYGSSKKYHNSVLGYNSRLDEIQASFLSDKLVILNEITNHKRKLASLYFEYLDDRFIKPQVDENYYDVYHIFNIRHKKRDLLKEYLLENGIQTEVHYPVPPNKQDAILKYIQGDFPISEEIHATTLSLPISFIHTKQDIMRVIEIMNMFPNIDG